MARRHELSDAEWTLLEPLLPARQTRGRYFHNHRQMLNAMLYRLHTGLPWRDLHERYGPWETDGHLPVTRRPKGCKAKLISLCVLYR